MKKIIILVSTILFAFSLNVLHSAEKAIVAEYTDLNGVYYVKYEGDKNWTAMNSESISNPVLTGKSEPGVNVFVNHGTIAIEYFDIKICLETKMYTLLIKKKLVKISK